MTGTTHDYFIWLLDKIHGGLGHIRLLKLLFDTDYRYTLAMDGNRYEDGMNLRYKFANDVGLDRQTISTVLGDKPCSVLEMMIALALRMEDIMRYDYDDDLEDRVSLWFYHMLTDLGLMLYDDDRYESRSDFVEKVRSILDTFMDNQYSPNGKGGLFYLPEVDMDLTTDEIWHQASIYLRIYDETH